MSARRQVYGDLNLFLFGFPSGEGTATRSQFFSRTVVPVLVLQF